MIHGSCLPTISNSVFSCVFTLIVFCFKEIDGVGLMPTVNNNGIPLEIPPVIPPLWFVEVLTSSPS